MSHAVRTARRPLLAIVVAVAALVAAVVAPALPAAAHEERESVFPDGTGSVPAYRPFDAQSPFLVVCKPDSRERVADIGDPRLRAFNQRLLGRCGFEHIQAAVDAVEEQGTNIYVLPGVYREEPSIEAACAGDFDGGVVSYEQLVACGEVLNLITVTGDDPDDEDITCDNQRCNLQIEGTGETAEDVLVRGGFDDSGDWIKHNGLKADRADGFYLRNMAFELFRENAIYVHETDGYVLDRTLTRYNDLYGILTFTSDHGVIRDCEGHHNGDSAIYPGSAADVNADNDTTGPLDRFAVEIFGCRSHHNALGYSGTAGNSVYMHDNEFFANGAGVVTDSFIPNHPGMPQDHLWLTDNRIHGNNTNFYEEFVQSGVCDAPPAERGYEDGTVCPAFPVPVGTGIMIAGGSHDLIENNHIYDNWRQGAMLFWVPAAIRDEFDPAAQFDTSNDNHYVDNVMGTSPDGLVQPNGIDFWWDDQGQGNCWQGNTSPTDDGEPTHNATDPRGLPDCDSGGSVFVASNPIKSAGLVGCSQYDREDNPEPAGCDWFDSPEEPEGRESGEEGGVGAALGDDTPLAAPASAPGPGLPATGGTAVFVLLGALLVVAARRLQRAWTALLP